MLDVLIMHRCVNNDNIHLESHFVYTQRFTVDQDNIRKVQWNVNQLIMETFETEFIIICYQVNYIHMRKFPHYKDSFHE